MSVCLVPVDFSSGTEVLLQAAVQLSSDLGSSLYLLHVVEPVSTYVPVGASMDVIAPPPSSVEDADAAARQERLHTLAIQFSDRGVAIETEVVVGLPVDEILTKSQLLKPRLILMASHGHGALYHLFTGSVVTGVLKKSEVPVVVVPVGSKV